MLLIVGAVFCVYWNSISGAFLWDDKYLVVKNTHIRILSDAPRLFTESLGAGYQNSFSFYRPIQALSYALDFHFWKLDARGYHVTNILLHALTAVLAYFLLAGFLKNNTAALFAALLFAVHPVHTEAVAYISGRADILAALFMLAALLAARRYTDEHAPPAVMWSAFFFLAALFSKESALMLPLLVLIVIKREQWRSLLKLFPAYVLSFAVYAMFRFRSQGVVSHVERSWGSFWERLPGVPAAVGQYMKILFWPTPLHMEYGRRLHAWTDLSVVLGALLLAAMLVAVAKGREGGIHRSLIMWFLVCLFPVINFFPINAWFSEHWVYLASLGIFAMVGLILTHRTPSQRDTLEDGRDKYGRQLTCPFGTGSVCLLVLLVGGLGFLTIKQNEVWHEPLSFFNYTLRYAPDSANAWHNLGILHQDIGDLDEAGRCYVKAIEADPNRAESYTNLGNVLKKKGKIREAVLLYEKALLIHPEFAIGYHDLANAVHAQGDYERAAFLYEKAIKIDPDHADTHFNLANEYLLLGRYVDAEKEYAEAVRINPSDMEAKQNLQAVRKRLTGPRP